MAAEHTCVCRYSFLFLYLNLSLELKCMKGTQIYLIIRWYTFSSLFLLDFFSPFSWFPWSWLTVENFFCHHHQDHLRVCTNVASQICTRSTELETVVELDSLGICKCIVMWKAWESLFQVQRVRLNHPMPWMQVIIIKSDHKAQRGCVCTNSWLLIKKQTLVKFQAEIFACVLTVHIFPLLPDKLKDYYYYKLKETMKTEVT